MQWYLSSLLVLTLLVLVGLCVGCLATVWLPLRMRPASVAFLSVPLGWAILTMIATLLGWFGPGYAGCHCGAITVLLAASGAWVGRDRLRRARGDCLRLVAFVPLASFPVLGPLMRIGSFNLYNDTYIYSAQALWLQHHNFWTPADTAGGHPAWGAVLTFQNTNLRMGASFLLGWIQAALHSEIPYEMFPAVAALGLICGALAVGATVLAACPQRWPEAWLTALAAAVTLNGFPLGATHGFLPQTWGLAFAAAAFGIRGLEVSAYGDGGNRSPWGAGVPLGLCVAASMHCYWDLLPLEGPALASTYLLPWPGVNPQRWRERWQRARIPLLVCALLVNGEWTRAVRGILLNIHVVVANPVAWPVWDFPAHALGLKSSVWERGRWLFHDPSIPMLAGGCAIVFICGFILSMPVRRNCRQAITLLAGRRPRLDWRPVIPAVTWVGMSAALFLYFRYLVPSPWHGQAQGEFPDGTGQSWSQYKLTIWASLFLICLIATLGIRWAATTRSALWRRVVIAVLGLWCGTGLGWNDAFSRRRGAQLLYDTGVRRDPFTACLAVRRRMDEVPAGDRIFLAWPDDGSGSKFREVMVLLLADHPLASNWSSGFSYASNINGFDAARTPDDCQWILRYRPPGRSPVGPAADLGGMTIEKHAR